MNFLSANDILKEKKPGERVTFFVRHAERRHITPEDEGYGEKVPLTETGRAQALAAGRELSAFTGTHFFGSSPVFRCRETAALMASGSGVPEYSDAEKVVPLEPLGDFYVCGFADYEHYLKEGFYPAVCRFLREGSLPGFLPLAEGSEKLLEFLLENSSAEVNVFCSHDAWIVPFLSHWTDIRFTPSLWLNFLSGAAILFDKNEKSRAKVLPLKFLGDGFLRF